jgi:hypothetical protein
VVTAIKATFSIQETYLLQAEHISVSYVDLKKKTENMSLTALTDWYLLALQNWLTAQKEINI